MSWTRPEHLVSRKDGIKGGVACVRETGIQAEFVAYQFIAGESIFVLAMDYQQQPREIEDAIRYCAACWRKHLAVD